jgi:hypothetical protein
MNAKEYSTHTIGMYLDGNYDGEGTYHSVLEIASACKEAYGDSAAYRLAGELREYVEQTGIGEEFFEGGSIAADLVGFMLSSCDWDELANDKLTEIEES